MWWLLERMLGLAPAHVPLAPQPPRPAHPLNAPGPVYVAKGCCLACGIWELDAPEHFAWSNEEFSQCYVSRQPATDEEFRKVARAIGAQDLDCIRVRGCPARWRAILEEMGQQEYIDADPD